MAVPVGVSGCQCHLTLTVVEIAAILAFALTTWGAATEPGRKVSATTWDILVTRFPALRNSRASFVGFSALALVAALLFLLGKPMLASSANQRGLAALESNHLRDAQAALERAVWLVPSNSRYHYNLGVAYELDQLKSEDALAQYYEARNLDRDYWPAYNSSGRLQLKSGANPESALYILWAGMSALAKEPNQNSIASRLGTAVIGKNIGWAHLEQGSLGKALEELKKAELMLLQLQDEGVDVRYYLAGTYYLMARTYMALDGPNADATKTAWAKTQGFALSIADSQVCPKYADLTEFYCADARVWLDEAERQLED